jgi:hypothetical protein
LKSTGANDKSQHRKRSAEPKCSVARPAGLSAPYFAAGAEGIFQIETVKQGCLGFYRDGPRPLTVERIGAYPGMTERKQAMHQAASVAGLFISSWFVAVVAQHLAARLIVRFLF